MLKYENDFDVEKVGVSLIVFVQIFESMLILVTLTVPFALNSKTTAAPEYLPLTVRLLYYSLILYILIQCRQV